MIVVLSGISEVFRYGEKLPVIRLLQLIAKQDWPVRGYTKIADRLTDTFFVDNTAIRGNEYCYRVLARFTKKSPNGIFEWDEIESVPSNEVCIYLPLDVPVLTKVSVQTTDATAGKMDIAWTKPKAGGTNLDTLLDPPPYRFDLYRSTGYNVASPQLVYSVTKNTYYDLNDTIFTDLNLNTELNPYTRIRFIFIRKLIPLAVQIQHHQCI
jgi:hypothetical protein